MFGTLRATRHAEALTRHVQRMHSLEVHRDAFEHEGEMRMVLATNFELACHASRALAALRKLEANEPLGARHQALRSYFTSTLELPAIRRAEVQGVDDSTIRRLYGEHVALTRPGDAGVESDGPESIDPEDFELPPKPIVEEALTALAEETGERFGSAEFLQWVLDRLQVKWMIMGRIWRTRGHLTPEDGPALERDYIVHFGTPKTRRDRRQREGWMAANAALQRGFVRTRKETSGPNPQAAPLRTRRQKA
ncbi:MAG: hypothetical protein P8125_12760 [Gemmatimonadota bacterium]